MKKLNRLTVCLCLGCGAAAGQSVNCDLQAYKPADGLIAEMRRGELEFVWRGERGPRLHGRGECGHS